MAISTQEIENMINASIPDAEITVVDMGGKFQLRVISDHFEGMSAVKRQQAIYRIINPHIQSGDIHAVSMQLLSRQEQNRS